MMRLRIAAPREIDREAWQQLYIAYADFYQVPMNQEILDTVWQWIFDASREFYCLLAYAETEVPVGFMHYRAMPSPLRGAMIGFLDDVFVAPHCRGQGAVDALFSNLQRDAKQRGWQLVRWITADNNYRGRGAYDKLASRTGWITYQMDL